MPGVPGIQSYTSVAASNTTYFPEGMAPSAVNDGMRAVQKDIRDWYTDAEWANLGDTPSRASASTFKVTGDVTTRYPVNSRLKLYDATTLYGVVTAIAYSAPDTTVTVGTDSGSLTTSLTSVARSIISPSNISIPTTIGRKGADIASATTTDLSTATGDFVDVTGTTTITGLGTIASGVMRTVRFTGILTLTHNATSLILPGAFSIVTQANDRATFRSLGSGNWLCVNYEGANGATIPFGFKGANIASATTTDLSTATGDFVDVTGTTTITGLGTAPAGYPVTVRFTGALLLTYNATSLILPGSASITTANGDTAIFRSLGSGNWKCISYTKQSGAAVVVAGGTVPDGAAINAQSTTVAGIFSTSSTTFVDITSASVTITPTSANSNVLVLFQTGGGNNNDHGFIQLVRTSTAIDIGTASGSRTPCTGSTISSQVPTGIDGVSGSYLDSPATTSATTYKLQALATSGTTFIGSSYSDPNSALGGRVATTITVIEIYHA